MHVHPRPETLHNGCTYQLAGFRRPWLRFPPSPFNFEKERSFDTKSCYVSQPSLQRQYR